MTQLATLHIEKQAHKFSAAHFTIFSETKRERLHGHNYGVSARIVAEMGSNGFSADYNVYKRCLQKICDAHDEYMLLPGRSPWLSVAERDGEYHATFGVVRGQAACTIRPAIMNDTTRSHDDPGTTLLDTFYMADMPTFNTKP